MEHEPTYQKGSSQKIKYLPLVKKKFKIITPRPNPGDCLIHHCLTVHGSSKNISQLSRKGFTFQFKNYYSKYDIKRKKMYEKSLNKQIQLRN